MLQQGLHGTTPCKMWRLGKRGAKRERRNYLGRQLRSNPPIITTTTKAWASYAPEMSLRMKSAESLVAASMQTTAGREYDGQIAKEFAEKFADVMQQCVQSAGDDLARFDFFVEVNPSGRIQQVLPSRATAVSHCLLPRLYSTTFAAPPKPEYWVKIQMNIGQ